MTELEELMQVIDHWEHPLTVYRFAEGKVHTIGMSDGMYEMFHSPDEPDKASLIYRFDHNMYRNASPDDVIRIVMEATRFAKEGGTYDVLYREKLFQKEEYVLVHAMGRHHTFSDGTRVAIIEYNCLSQAVQANLRSELGTDNTLRSFLDHSDLAMAVIQRADGDLLYCNQPMAGILQPARRFDTGISFSEFLYGRDDPAVLEHLSHMAGRGNQLVTVKTTGENVLFRVTEREWEGHSVYYLQSEPWNEIWRDSLTGLMNLPYFRHLAPGKIRALLNEGGTPCILYFALLGFREFNIRFGMQAGDVLMKSVAVQLQQAFPEGLVCRSEDNHFLALSDTKDLEPKLGHLSESVRGMTHSVLLQLKTGIFVGKNTRPWTEEEIAAGCDRARAACGTITKNARKSFAVYDRKAEDHALQQSEILGSFQRALDEHWIKVFYQPIVDVRTGKLKAFEALARWKDPEKGYLSPAAFIPALEDHHLVGYLDRYMVREVCRQAPERKRLGFSGIPVSVNLSRDDFENEDVFSEFVKIMKAYGAESGDLIVEITERLFSDCSAIISEQVQKFKKAGFQVWMDDFGSEYSSLGMLQSMEVDLLKLDIRFLKPVQNEKEQERVQKSLILLREVIRLAGQLGLGTLCEGVETIEQWKILQEAGCGLAQGFYFGRPAPLDDLQREKGK